MKFRTTFCLLGVFTLLLSTAIFSQDKSYSEGIYTLHFSNLDTTIDDSFNKRLISAFFTVYPKLADRFNKNTAKEVTFVVDPAFEGVAATGNAKTVFNAEWFHKYPNDIDVVTHEVMHIVQAYPHNTGPWWVTEGIADYVRYKYGVDNAGGNWALPELKPEHNYDNSYRITARFFVWLENHVNSGIIDSLDSIMRSADYKPEFWKKFTGKNIDQLWLEYTRNPSLLVETIE